jgi:hypothetical protein
MKELEEWYYTAHRWLSEVTKGRETDEVLKIEHCGECISSP